MVIIICPNPIQTEKEKEKRRNPSIPDIFIPVKPWTASSSTSVHNKPPEAARAIDHHRCGGGGWNFVGWFIGHSLLIRVGKAGMCRESSLAHRQCGHPVDGRTLHPSSSSSPVEFISGTHGYWVDWKEKMRRYGGKTHSVLRRCAVVDGPLLIARARKTEKGKLPSSWETERVNRNIPTFLMRLPLLFFLPSLSFSFSFQTVVVQQLDSNEARWLWDSLWN